MLAFTLARRHAIISRRFNAIVVTGVPVPFECAYAIAVEDCSKVESALHIAFGPSRINPNREFFKIDSEQAIAILKILGQKDVTPEVSSELNSNVSQAEKDSGKKLKKRPNMNFSEMGIQPGSQLLFKDGITKVQVSGDRKIVYNGEIMTLTAATRKVMNIDYSVQPSPHWTFEGKLLKDIYDDVYSDDDSS